MASMGFFLNSDFAECGGTAFSKEVVHYKDAI